MAVDSGHAAGQGVLHMKRLIVPMVIFVTALATASTAFAQSKDLAGSWVLDVEKSGKKDGPPMVVITLTDKEFAARLGGPTARLMTFKLDGTETTLTEGVKAKAAWKGNKLEATITGPTEGPESVLFSRDGAWLVMEGSSKEHGPMKFYFKKAPSTTSGPGAILLRTRPARP
jgi:hypothetical protein